MPESFQSAEPSGSIPVAGHHAPTFDRLSLANFYQLASSPQRAFVSKPLQVHIMPGGTVSVAAVPYTLLATILMLGRHLMIF
ncbi:MAG: hypothetical protein U5R30_08345 [Deltaproteobacteria bacterium]|nr:hypothetical protein [Deltaproteobacteria bacterium]